MPLLLPPSPCEPWEKPPGVSCRKGQLQACLAYPSDRFHFCQRGSRPVSSSPGQRQLLIASTHITHSDDNPIRAERIGALNHSVFFPSSIPTPSHSLQGLARILSLKYK